MNDNLKNDLETLENADSKQGPDDKPGTEGTSILIVEDNPVMQQIIGKLLKNYPVKYHYVNNGIEAIEIAKENEYALILMDIMMPKMGGVQATAKIRELSTHYQEIPILAVTAKVSDQDMEEYLNEGMSGTIKKPINKVNLADALSEHLGITAAENAPEIKEEYLLSADEMDILNWETLNEYRSLLKGKFKFFLKDYLVAGPQLMNAIGDAIDSDNPKDVQFHAHKLKSTSQVFGAEIVSDLAAKLELMGKNQNLDEAKTVYHDLHIAYERAQYALKKKLVLLQNM